MSYSTIDKPTDYFNTVTYTGTAGGQTISGVGNQPDFIWVKQTGDAGYDHSLHNSVSGLLKQLISNDTSAEITNTDTVISNNADGFVLGADTAGPNANSNNQDGKNYVAWNWKANGAGSANTDGSISSTVSVNTTAGFSIVSYSGSASNVTVGHGLGVAPKMIIFKNKTSSSSWTVYNANLGNAKRLVLNNTNAEESTNQFSFGTTPTSSVFALGGGYGDVCTSGADYIAYCFAEKQGYSKFGSYKGNGNANGTFVYTGFKPAWVMVKNTVNNARFWTIIDNKRNPFNPEDEWLYANNNDATFDASSFPTDFVSNGIKIRNTGSYFNTSGENYIYMAFAENPLVGSNFVPTTAR